VDETVVEGPHLWGFIPEIGGYFPIRIAEKLKKGGV
jgi:hypothetical protein